MLTPLLAEKVGVTGGPTPPKNYCVANQHMNNKTHRRCQTYLLLFACHVVHPIPRHPLQNRPHGRHRPNPNPGFPIRAGDAHLATQERTPDPTREQVENPPGDLASRGVEEASARTVRVRGDVEAGKGHPRGREGTYEIGGGKGGEEGACREVDKEMQFGHERRDHRDVLGGGDGGHRWLTSLWGRIRAILRRRGYNRCGTRISLLEGIPIPVVVQRDGIQDRSDWHRQ